MKGLHVGVGSFLGAGSAHIFGLKMQWRKWECGDGDNDQRFVHRVKGVMYELWYAQVSHSTGPNQLNGEYTMRTEYGQRRMTC